MATDFPTDSATSWFDDVYRRAGRNASAIPWANLDPSPWLGDVLATVSSPGKAVVVGCGLGDDAEALASAGFDTIAFDVSVEAVAWCRDRFPESEVSYRVADLLELPTELVGSADVVVEVRTVQSLPLLVRPQAIRTVADLLAPGGALLVVALGRPDDTVPTGPPWAVSDLELRGFGDAGLESVSARVERGQFVRVYRRTTQ